MESDGHVEAPREATLLRAAEQPQEQLLVEPIAGVPPLCRLRWPPAVLLPGTASSESKHHGHRSSRRTDRPSNTPSRLPISASRYDFQNSCSNSRVTQVSPQHTVCRMENSLCTGYSSQQSAATQLFSSSLSTVCASDVPLCAPHMLDDCVKQVAAQRRACRWSCMSWRTTKSVACAASAMWRTRCLPSSVMFCGAVELRGLSANECSQARPQGVRVRPRPCCSGRAAPPVRRQRNWLKPNSTPTYNSQSINSICIHFHITWTAGPRMRKQHKAFCANGPCRRRRVERGGGEGVMRRTKTASRSRAGWSDAGRTAGCGMASASTCRNRSGGRHTGGGQQLVRAQICGVRRSPLAWLSAAAPQACCHRRLPPPHCRLRHLHRPLRPSNNLSPHAGSAISTCRAFSHRDIS